MAMLSESGEDRRSYYLCRTTNWSYDGAESRKGDNRDRPLKVGDMKGGPGGAGKKNR